LRRRLCRGGWVCDDDAPAAEYRVLVAGSRELARRNEPVRAIRTEFTLPPSTDPEFLYKILGGRVDANASASAVIRADGSVRYD
jgi:hypothetical protein